MHAYQNAQMTSISTRSYLKYNTMYYYYVAVYCVSFLVFIIELFFHRAARSKTILIITSSIYCIINRYQTNTVVRLYCPEISYYTLEYCRLLSIVISYNIIVNLYINVCGFLCTRERDYYNYFNFFSSFIQNQTRGAMTAVYIVYLLPTLCRWHTTYND